MAHRSEPPQVNWFVTADACFPSGDGNLLFCRFDPVEVRQKQAAARSVLHNDAVPDAERAFIRYKAAFHGFPIESASHNPEGTQPTFSGGFAEIRIKPEQLRKVAVSERFRCKAIELRPFGRESSFSLCERSPLAMTTTRRPSFSAAVAMYCPNR